MSDDDQLHRLLGDAASEIEPGDRLAEIRASVRSDSQVVAMRRPRPWLYAVTGAVASAAVIGVIAFTSNALSGPDATGPSFANGGSPGPTVTTATATDPAAPTGSASASGTDLEPYSVYYLGADGARRPVLFREWHHGPPMLTADPEGNGDDLLTEAVSDAMDAIPADPDYRTPWRGLATLDSASYTATGAGHTLRITLSGHDLAARPADLTKAEARAAVQQLVYTAQAAIGERVPVSFVIGGEQPRPHPMLLGVPIPAQGVVAGPALSTLSLIDISLPVEGAPVSGVLTVTGENNGFKGDVLVYLERHGRKFLKTSGPGGTGVHRPYTWRVRLDLGKVRPGEYTLVAADGAGAGHGRPDRDTRTIEVK